MSRPLRVCLYVEYLYPVVSEGRVPFAGDVTGHSRRRERLGPDGETCGEGHDEGGGSLS